LSLSEFILDTIEFLALCATGLQQFVVVAREFVVLGDEVIELLGAFRRSRNATGSPGVSIIR
jgi:hypothetical protein